MIEINDVLTAVECPVCHGDGIHSNPNFKRCRDLNIETDCLKCGIKECKDFGEFVRCNACDGDLILLKCGDKYYRIGCEV